MTPDGWVRLEDGMPDPRVGGEELARRRQQAIHDVIGLMGCSHRRGDNCDHVDAIRLLAEAVSQTAVGVLVEAVRDLPRPLSMARIEQLAKQMTTVSLVAANDTERRRNA